LRYHQFLLRNGIAMKIGYICYWDLSRHEAATIHVFGIADNLSRMGHSVTVFAPNIGKYRQSTPTEVVYLPAPFGQHYGRLLYNLSLFSSLAHYIHRHKPDCFYVRDISWLHAPWLLGRLCRIPTFLEVNGIWEAENPVCSPLSHPPRSLWNYFAHRVTAAANSVSYRSHDYFLAVTPWIRDLLASRRGISADRIAVVPNGVDVGLYRPMEKSEACRYVGLAPDRPTIGFIGRFYQHQGVENFISAAPHIVARVPKVLFPIVGYGPLQNKYQLLVNEKGLTDSFLFTGYVDREQSVHWVNVLDIAFTLAFHMPQGFVAIKLFTYMACGKPVVATRTRGYTLLDEIGAGVTVPLEDPETIAEVFVRLLDDLDARNRMGALGRKYVEENQTWRHHATVTARFLEDRAAEYRTKRRGLDGSH